jgi:hypothetical protein
MILLGKMARLEGFERPTAWFVARKLKFNLLIILIINAAKPTTFAPLRITMQD